jgi:hypothetical protein
MIEIRVVDKRTLTPNGLIGREEIQYRYKLPENEQWINRKMELVEWSDWETAEYVKLEDI